MFLVQFKLLFFYNLVNLNLFQLVAKAISQFLFSLSFVCLIFIVYISFISMIIFIFIVLVLMFS